MGQWRHLVTGILEEKFHNQFRAISADFKEVKTMNLKHSANQKKKNESNPPPEWQYHTAHQSVHKGGTCNNGDAILQMMTYWNTECDNERDFVEKYSQLWKAYTHDICKFHYNCNNTFWEKKKEALLLYWPLTR